MAKFAVALVLGMLPHQAAIAGSTSSITTSVSQQAADTGLDLLQIQQQQQGRHLQQQTPPCGQGSRLCGTKCVPLASPAACGPACTRCPKPPANGVATCSKQGVCGVSCRAGYERAGKAACRLCKANTFKAAAGPGPCSACPAGTATPRLAVPAARDSVSDCVVPVSCPPGQQPDPATLSSCSVCPANTIKTSQGPDSCIPCPPATVAPGRTAETHSSADNCMPIACPPGLQRNLAAGGCQVCPANTWKDAAGPEPCLSCPAASFTAGDAPGDHNEPQDCFPATCKPGTELDPVSLGCSVCGPNTFKPGLNADRCSACPNGTQTLGNDADDHDELAKCYSGGLIASSGNTGGSAEALADFTWELQRSLNNSGGQNGRGGSGSSKGKKKKACLFACDGLPDVDVQLSVHVAHIAGSPAVYFSNDPSHVRSGVSLVSPVRNQQGCGTCVNHAIASAAETAVAAALRVDARGLNISHTFAYFCAPFFGSGAGGMRSCGTGWSFEPALEGMRTAPAAFFMNGSCLGRVDPAVAQLPDAQLEQFCVGVPGACKSATFTCTRYKAMSDGLAQVQRYIRQYGSVITRIIVTDSFMDFFRFNRTGVFNGTADNTTKSYLHAVQLIGYDNEVGFFLAKNSMGVDWGDQGMFRIAYGAADVAFPEDTFALIDCFTNSSQSEDVAAWLDRWPVAPDMSELPDSPDCVLYTATERDSISGIADHFQADILRLIQDNVKPRGVIPTLELGDPPWPEPQLQPDGSWAGAVFRVCGIPENLFDRVATDPCSMVPNYCNGRQARCKAGRCVCAAGYSGRFCESGAGPGGEVKDFTLDGQLYRLYPQPMGLTWTNAQQRCQADGMRLARLYSSRHASEINKQVQKLGKPIDYWIGLNDRQKEGSYSWVSGSAGATETPLDFDPLWSSNFRQPDNAGGNEDCVQVWNINGERYLVSGSWNDAPCDQTYAFLCSSASDSINPCVRFPCSTNGAGAPVGCKASSNITHEHGRQCMCEAGLTYVSDELGCVQPIAYDVESFVLAGLQHQLFVSPFVTWTSADKLCRDRGMALPKISSDDYAAQLHSAVKARLASKGVSNANGWWIGLSDRATEGQFVWSDGMPLTFARWAPGQPDNICRFVWKPNNYCVHEAEDCVQAWFKTAPDVDGFWNDIECWADNIVAVCVAAA